MAAPDGAYVVKDAIVTIDAVEYANQVRIARIVPTQEVQTYRTLVPDGVVQDVDSPSYVFELAGLQINKAGGLAKALRALTLGEEVEVILAPRDLVGDDKATFTIVSMRPPFGGEQGKFAEMEMSFPVKGEPVYSAISA